LDLYGAVISFGLGDGRALELWPGDDMCGEKWALAESFDEVVARHASYRERDANPPPSKGFWSTTTLQPVFKWSE
jgi:hypothetical protein